jgi:hypothetical protein
MILKRLLNEEVTMRTRLVCITVLVLLMSVTGCADWGPIGQVLATRVMDPLVRQIGETDIQRQKVLNAIEAAKAEIARLQRVEAENSVKAEMLSEKLEALKANREESRKRLLQLADLIEAGQPITLTNGTVMSVSELTAYAERKKREFEVLNRKITIYQKSIDLLMTTAKEAHDRWVEGKATVAELEAQLELLDAQIAALEAVKAQPEIARAAGSYEDLISEAQRVTEEVMEKLERERRTIERLRELQATEGEPIQSQLDQLELDLKSSSDLVAELRSLAGE